MTSILKLEELAMFLGGIFAFSFLPLEPGGGSRCFFLYLILGCLVICMEIKPAH
jgi:hypothetical protein